MTDLISALHLAIKDRQNGRVLAPEAAHDWIRRTYTWQNVAARTEVVYNKISAAEEVSLADRLYR